MGRNSLAEQRRTQIIEAFYSCVVKDGLARASIRKIAKQAGMQPSALHHYFKDRDEMIQEMVIYYTNIFFESFQSQINAIKDPNARLIKAVEFLFGPAMINEEASGFFYDCMAEAKKNTRIRKSLAKMFRKFRKTIIDYFMDLEMADNFSKEQVKNIATLIIAVHEGVELQWHICPKDVSLKKSMGLAMQIIDMFMRGNGAQQKRRQA